MNRALLNPAAEVTKALSVFKDTASQRNLQTHSCSGVLLKAGHYAGYKALDSHINSKLQNGRSHFLFTPLLSPKRPQFTFTEQSLVAALRH